MHFIRNKFCPVILACTFVLSIGKDYLNVGSCTGKWSSWKDRDNPTIEGDFEQLKDFPLTDDLCLYPVAAQARIIGSTNLSTTELVKFSLNGFFCRNADQPKGSCSDYEVRFCCRATNLNVGTCKGRWSSWKDRDNPSGNGDYELLKDFSQTDDLCLKASAVQARKIGSPVLETDEIVKISLDGFSCVNGDQPQGGCSDYEVRFCCGATNSGATNLNVGTCKGRWSSWKDRDNPSGNGDYELLKDFSPTGDLCPKALAVQARMIGSSVLETDEIVKISLAGFSCVNDDQFQGGCSDYEVRFCCETNTVLSVGSCKANWNSWVQWSTWQDRDNPSGTGDYEPHELLIDNNFCPNPMAAQARIIGTRVLSTSEVVTFSIHGLTCRNIDQPGGGKCSDYEVRFCCSTGGFPTDEKGLLPPI